MKEMGRKAKGITLIALVITIIVLLILAGVTIATLTGENGILTKATEARNASEYAGAREAVETEVLGSFDDKGNYDANKAKENLEKNLGATVILNPDGTLDVYYNGYHFKVSADGEVTFVGEDEGAETSGRKFKQVSAGQDFTLAIDESGNIWSWGSNSYGQLGNGESGYSNNVLIPTQIMNEITYIKISAGAEESFGIDSEGNIWIWGGNYNGQLGDGTGANITEPKKLELGSKFKEIAAGQGSSFIIDENGYMWSTGWGCNGRSTVYSTFQKIRI